MMMRKKLQLLRKESHLKKLPRINLKRLLNTLLCLELWELNHLKRELKEIQFLQNPSPLMILITQFNKRTMFKSIKLKLQICHSQNSSYSTLLKNSKASREGSIQLFQLEIKQMKPCSFLITKTSINSMLSKKKSPRLLKNTTCSQ